MSDARTGLGNSFVTAESRRRFPKNRSIPTATIGWFYDPRPDVDQCNATETGCIFHWKYVQFSDVLVQLAKEETCWRWIEELCDVEFWRGAGWFRCQPNFFLEPQDDWPASCLFAACLPPCSACLPAMLKAEQRQGAWYVNRQSASARKSGGVNFSAKQRNKMKFRKS